MQSKKFFSYGQGTKDTVKERVTFILYTWKIKKACKRKALDCKPKAYHGFSKGNNLGISSFFVFT